MKILWLSHILPYPPKGGVMQRSYNLIKEVAKENEVYLFAFNQKAWLPTKEDIIKAKKEFERFCKKVEVFELPSDKSKAAWYSLVLKSFFSKDGYTINWTKSKTMMKKIKEFLATNHIDLIHFDTIGLAEYVKEIKEIPKVLNHHNIESHMMLRRAKKEKNPLKKIYFLQEAIKLRKYEKQVCPNFNMNLVVSELDKERLLNIAPNSKVEVIPNGVDINYFKPLNSKIKRHNIVFAGRMNAYPNEDAVIWFLKEIWPLLKKEVPDATFTIAGRNPTPRIKKFAKNDPSILVTGYVDDIRPFIAQAEVYICPIRDGGGTKLKILDAMAMGKIIVTTTIGAEGLGVIHERHVLIANDPKISASQVLLVFNNPDLRKYLSQNARQLVEKKYSWEIIGKKLNSLYQKMCS